MQDIKSIFIRIVRKSFADVRAKWLNRRLCVTDLTGEEWTSAKQLRQ